MHYKERTRDYVYASAGIQNQATDCGLILYSHDRISSPVNTYLHIKQLLIVLSKLYRKEIAMLDNWGTTHAMPVSKLEEICQNGKPETAGILEHQGELIFGLQQEGTTVLVSLQEIHNLIEAFELTNTPKDQLTLVFFVESFNPTRLFCHVFTEEDIEEMREEEAKTNLKPASVH